MSDEIVIDSEQYISSKRASELSGYAQDYVGQLARGGQLNARRIGGLWYIGRTSLDQHKERADSYKPVPPAYNQDTEQQSLLSFDGKTYVSAPYAAKLTGYTADYVGQLARAGTILSRQVGNRWYVDRQSITAHKRSKDALLAAVQAESVGIKKQDPQEAALKDVRYGSAGPFLTYTRDDGDLFPSRTADPFHRGDEISIPVHIVYSDMSVIDDSGMHPQREARRVPQMTKYYGLLPVAALTIVIVITLGFASMKGYALYAKGSPIMDTSIQTAAAGVVSGIQPHIVRIGDFLEPILTDEIVYRRQVIFSSNRDTKHNR